MNKSEAKSKIHDLSEELRHHNYLYYVMSTPKIGDFEFDKLMKELEDLEGAFPDLKLDSSPTQRIGGTISKEFESFEHLRPMLSLKNTYSEEEIIEFEDSVNKILENKPFTTLCQHKFDGVSLSLHYENGELVRAVTRGDGKKGDIVTANARTIKNLPLMLRGDEFPGQIEVRGEVFMPLSIFRSLNEERKANGEATLMNPRNTTSGTLKMQDSAVVARRGLKFVAFQLLSDEPLPSSDFEQQQELKKWGFYTDEALFLGKSTKEIVEYIESWSSKMDSLDFEIDGIVLKVNEIPLRVNLGSTSKFPRWAIAYKYPSEAEKTVLENVSYQVGRTGVITPVAELTPVLIKGTIVKRASLYNADEINRLDLRIGDTVTVEKGGEIIPKVTGIVIEFRPEDSIPINFIKNCPDCGTELIKIEEEVNAFCPNSYGCPAQIKGRLSHFASRKGMDINGLGPEILSQLVEAGLVTNPADLYNLEYSSLVGLDRFAEKSAQNLIESIEKSREVPYERVIYALGIRFVGETVAFKIAQKFPSIEELMKAETEEIEKVYEIGERISESLVKYLERVENKEIIYRLKDSGLQFSYIEKENSKKGDTLEGISFVVSGIFEKFSRDGLKKEIISLGGVVKSSVTKKVNYLLVGKDPGPSKVEKATSSGVSIITEEEYLEWVS